MPRIITSCVLRVVSSALLLTSCVTVSLSILHAADEQPFGIERRIAWTTSRVIGSPDPPLPYKVEKTFTNIKWQAPIYVTPEPDTDYLLVVQQGGEKERPSKILRVRDDPNADTAETLLEVSNRLVYSVAFHPAYRTNGYLFVFSNGPTPEKERTNRISRFNVERQAPHRCDPKSEQVIIEWRSAGHDGGGMVFDHEGMLYISTGDGTSDSDGWVTGQDLSDLLGGVLRIDADHPDGTQPYSVPKDNPFVGWKNARPELWAYGLRNPWRMTIDRKTGQIWTGNNGQDLWETAHLVRRGENYGWSVYEGSHPFYLNRKLGPTLAVPPTIEHHHAEARSLTGGVVYYGNTFPDLNGVYVYGDYSSGTIWGARHDGSRVVWRQELARTELQIAAFAVDHHGELLIVDHAGGLYRLVRSSSQGPTPKFPTRLSETGLFVSTKAHQVHPGLIPYSVNAPGWTDGAHVERFIALPGEARIDYASSGGSNAPNGAVLVQTLSLEREVGDPASRRRIETRLLTRQQGQWIGYSYRWDERQSDATLVGAKGDEREFVMQDRHAPRAVRRQVWRYPSRAECMACHSRAANFVLGLTEPQLNKVHDYGAVRDNQLRTLQHLGVFTKSLSKPPAELPKLVDPYDSGQILDARARSYLHANCSVCHVEAGGGNAKMELAFTTAPERMNVFGARPQHDTFGIDNAMLISPGDPERSILFQRVSRRGRGQMPPLVTTVVDERAVALFRDWVRDMKPEQKFVRDWKMEDLLPSLDHVKRGRSFESGRTAFRQTGCSQCHRFAGDGGSVGPELTGVGRRLPPRDLLESILLPSKAIAEGYANTEIETGSGEVVAGRIEREDDRVLVLRPVSATDELVTIRKKDIRRRGLSGISNMPAGVLDTLHEAQVLDLLAYLISDGDSDHAAFRSGVADVPAAK
jgi:uncharacterized repeat protein (TIGR03806 family)